MSRRGLTLSPEDVEKHNAKVRTGRLGVTVAQSVELRDVAPKVASSRLARHPQAPGIETARAIAHVAANPEHFARQFMNGTAGTEAVDEELRRLGVPVGVLSKQKKRKYRNEPIVVDGIKFDSRHEAQVWRDLKLRERAGDIRGLQRQVSFPLTVAGKRIQRFRPDFWYWELDRKDLCWRLTIADAKSAMTASLPAWTRSKALFEALYGLLVVEL